MIDLSQNRLQKNYTWVWPGDPAIDVPLDDDGEEDREALLEIYERYLDGTATLPTKSGQTPTEWELRHLDEKEKREFSYYVAQGVDHAQYFAAAVALVAAIQPDGKFELERRRDERGFVRVTDEYMNRIGKAAPGLINDMASRVIRSMSPSKN